MREEKKNRNDNILAVLIFLYSCMHAFMSKRKDDVYTERAIAIHYYKHCEYTLTTALGGLDRRETSKGHEARERHGACVYRCSLYTQTEVEKGR